MPSENFEQLDPELEGQIDELRGGKVRQADPDEIIRVVQSIIEGMNSDIPSLETEIRADLEALADYIQVTKSEIMSIDPEGIPDEHLPAATIELDAIVRATEKATHGIMEAAEDVEQVASGLDPEQGEILINATTKIFEACSFQDITGQRISKVISALQNIEEKVESLISVFGGDDLNGREERRKNRIAQREAEGNKSVEEMDEKEFLQGPQLPENAISQDDIDSLFASLD